MKIRNQVFMMMLFAFSFFALLLLTGADQPQSSQVGRYRMSVTARGNFTDIYVIDTVTGIVKYIGKDEGKPFEQIMGK